MFDKRLLRRLSWGILFLLVFIASPLLGVALTGESLLPFLQFPPGTKNAAHASFSWYLFIPLLLLVIFVLWPFVKRLLRGRLKPFLENSDRRFPLWGWLTVFGCSGFWILAWTRFPFFDLFQRFTFFPLWFCLIVILNALAFRLSGSSLMTHRPLYFSLLFPTSAGFWWAFEYLNRFVKNWHYTGVAEIGGLQYFLEASLSFSTVLPAVMSMRFLLLQLPAFSEEYDDFPALPLLKSGVLWGLLGSVSVCGLVGIGWKPELTYPLLWIAPGLLWVAFQKWKGFTDPMLQEASEGNLSLLWSSAVAALMCGFFWEMWNLYSEAKWIYNIPGVARFYLFEMPLLGYAGYLPFGVICALASNSLLNLLHGKYRVVEEEIKV